jgi:hypothetical protein
LPLHAATFSCQFFPASAGGTPSSCTVDSMKIAPCQHNYSATLMAWCQGGTDVPSTVNHLGCFFGTPAAVANVGAQTASSEQDFAKPAALVAGVLAKAMEWLPNASATGNNLGLMYIDGAATYIVLCDAT